MNSSKKIAITVGILFIIGTVTGILSVIFTGPVLDGPDYLIKVAANEQKLIAGALFVLIMGLALAMVPVMMFPILKKQNEALALGYVVFRGALEPITYIANVICLLLLLTLGQEYIKAGTSDVSLFQTLGALILEAIQWISHILKVVFPLGALIFNYILYRSKLIPRWLSGWGIIAVTLHFAEGLLTMFGITIFGLLPADAETVMAFPIFLQEMVFAVWLIGKGFNSSAIVSGLPESMSKA